MLDKINNINSSGDFSRSAKPKTFNGVIGSIYNRGMNSHDSADISPAFKYLQQTQWRLRDFQYSADERIFLHFIVSTIEFQTTIDLTNFNGLTSLNYHLAKDGIIGISKKKMAVDLTSVLKLINYAQQPELISFTGLNIFFNRAFEQRIYKNLTRDDQYFFDELLMGIIENMSDEFLQLNNQILIFIERLTGIKHLDNLPLNQDDVRAIQINTIKIIDAERTNQK